MAELLSTIRDRKALQRARTTWEQAFPLQQRVLEVTDQLLECCKTFRPYGILSHREKDVVIGLGPENLLTDNGAIGAILLLWASKARLGESESHVRVARAQLTYQFPNSGSPLPEQILSLRFHSRDRAPDDGHLQITVGHRPDNTGFSFFASKKGRLAGFACNDSSVTTPQLRTSSATRLALLDMVTDEIEAAVNAFEGPIIKAEQIVSGGISIPKSRQRRRLAAH
jgi:hypothetical protein